MPAKLSDHTKQVHLLAPVAFVKKVDTWRRRQPDLPNLSEAIRRLVELGMESAKKRGGRNQ